MVFGLSSPSNDLGAILRPPEIGSNIAERRQGKNNKNNCGEGVAAEQGNS
jgi:hypothetical protein